MIPPDSPTYQQLSEWAVQAAQGDEAAFTRIYLYYNPKILRSYRSKLRGVPAFDRSRELCADFWGTIWAKLPLYNPKTGHFGGWIYTAAEHYLIDHVRKAKNAASSQLFDQYEDQWQRSVLDQIEHRLVLEPLLGVLTRKQREAIYYRYLQGRSVNESARLMGKEPNAIKQLTARALGKMQRQAFRTRQSLSFPHSTES